MVNENILSINSQQPITVDLSKKQSNDLQASIALYGSIVKAVVIRVLGRDHPEIEECVSDAFVKVWKNTPKDAPPEHKMKAYIIAIARNTAIDVLRKQKAAPPQMPLEDAVLESDFDLENEYARTENARIVRESVDSLPEPDRTVFLRRYFFAERVKDIARLTGLGDKQVENILHRGKKKLEQDLLERGVIR